MKTCCLLSHQHQPSRLSHQSNQKLLKLCQWTVHPQWPPDLLHLPHLLLPPLQSYCPCQQYRVHPEWISFLICASPGTSMHYVCVLIILYSYRCKTLHKRAIENIHVFAYKLFVHARIDPCSYIMKEQ